MKVKLIICGALLMLSGSIGLVPAQVKSDSSVVLVKGWLASRARGIRFSVTEKRVNRLGDKAVIALHKIYTDEELNDPAKIQSFLPLIQAAFEHPELIASAEDKQPQATLLLLNKLKGKLSDSTQRGQIEQLTSFVKEKSSAH